MTSSPHGFKRFVVIATLIGPFAIGSVGEAATLKNGVPTLTKESAVPAVALPKRNDVLVVDWVDTMAARIAIGGVTYPLKGHPPKVFLASGEEVTTIGWLKPGMRTRIETIVDVDGRTRLATVRVEP